VLILGPSGSGKSALALQLVAFGARLVSDDRTCLSVRDDHLIAQAPETIKGQIEARFIGILAAPVAGPTPVHLVVDLEQSETHRLPEPKSTTILGCTLPLIHKADAPHFAAALFLYLSGTRLA
jgi:HPr kinase/phosphorylase